MDYKFERARGMYCSQGMKPKFMLVALDPTKNVHVYNLLLWSVWGGKSEVKLTGPGAKWILPDIAKVSLP